MSCSNSLRGHTDFVVIDVTGVHNVAVHFCLCDSRVEKRQQLMHVYWWLATVRDPQTCATFAVIRLFRILNCQAKVSAHDFLRSLEMLTNNDGMKPVYVCASTHVPKQMTDPAAFRIVVALSGTLSVNTGQHLCLSVQAAGTIPRV